MDIFELLDNKFDLKKQVNGLNTMLFTEKTYYSAYTGYSFGEVFDEVLFRSWKYSLGRTSVIDALSDLNLYSNNDNNPVKKLNTEIDIYASLQFDFNIFSYGSDYRNKLGRHCISSI